jgi:S1-C subfamily serine protease
MLPLRCVALLTVVALTACARATQTGAGAPEPYTQLYQRLHPSIVLITMQIPADDPKRKGKWDEAYGSGAIIESGAWGSRILTDAQVVADARDLRAKTGDAGKAVPLRVVAVSDDDDDLALLEIPTPNLKPITLGDMSTVVAGRDVGVLGYPIPDAFEDEHLDAVVSLYTGRIASVRNGTMEIDVPIIPGESGGPVFDAATGKVIGLAESRFDDERAIGFATPVDIIARFLAAHPHE